MDGDRIYVGTQVTTHLPSAFLSICFHNMVIVNQDVQPKEKKQKREDQADREELQMAQATPDTDERSGVQPKEKKETTSAAVLSTERSQLVCCFIAPCLFRHGLLLSVVYL